MARGKIQIKKIENQTNRQVTYSKRRNGLFKKAHELTVLCDAKISIIMISSTQKLHKYISPTLTTKQIIDEYQKTAKADLWSSHYEKMQEHLKKLREINRNLEKEISQRMGESLNDLGYEQMVNLIEDMDSSLKLIRERKYKVISNRTDTSRKRLRNVEEIHRGLDLVLQFDARQEDPHYGLVENEGDYNSICWGFHMAGRGSSPFARRLTTTTTTILAFIVEPEPRTSLHLLYLSKCFCYIYIYIICLIVYDRRRS